MHAKMIEHTLKKIVEIDAKAVLVQKEVEDVEVEKQKELKKRLKEIEFQHMKQARRLAKEQYDIMIARAELDAQHILEASKVECERLDALLESHQEEMVEKVFMRLFELRLRSPAVEE